MKRAPGYLSTLSILVSIRGGSRILKKGVRLKKYKNSGVKMGALHFKFVGLWHSKLARVVPQIKALTW